MAENRWQIAIGAVVLLLMLLAGAFSIGVYVGRHGLSREGLQYQPETQADIPQDRVSANRPEGIPAGQPDLTGKLRSVLEQGLELATQQGIRFITIDEETRFVDGNGGTIDVSDLHAGDVLAIFGDFTADEGRRLLANVIVRLPLRSQPQP
jgi:hypothetical protein